MWMGVRLHVTRHACLFYREFEPCPESREAIFISPSVLSHFYAPLFPPPGCAGSTIGSHPLQVGQVMCSLTTEIAMFG